MRRSVDERKQCFAKVIDSPVGSLTLVASNDGLAALIWANDDPRRVSVNIVAESPDHPVLVETARQLHEYFAGDRTAFDLPLDLVGPEFQQQVWKALLTIPFGETRTYTQIAQQIGRPDAVRAVGAATRLNPISIVAPCHRVVGAAGQLTGCAGGVAAKARLLTLEGSYAAPAGVR